MDDVFYHDFDMVNADKKKELTEAMVFIGSNFGKNILINLIKDKDFSPLEKVLLKIMYSKKSVKEMESFEKGYILAKKILMSYLK